MSIATTKAALYAKHAALGINTPQTYDPPPDVSESDLPMVIIKAEGRGEWDQPEGSIGFAGALNFIRVNRTYTLTYLVKPVQLGAPITDGYQAAEALLDSVGYAFMDDPRLLDAQGRPQVDQILSLSDEGVQSTIVYGLSETLYWGFVYTMVVTIL